MHVKIAVVNAFVQLGLRRDFQNEMTQTSSSARYTPRCPLNSEIDTYRVLQKRKATHDETESSKSKDEASTGEYETGRVICEVCGEGVSFRDESTNVFTLKHWDAHRQDWYVHSLLDVCHILTLTCSARLRLSHPLSPQ